MTSITRRRWRVFFSQPRARLGLLVFGVLLFFSMSAELWSNHNPLVIARRDAPTASRRFYFPALFKYPAVAFGVTDSFVVDFKELVKKEHEEGKDTWALFPLNLWDPFIQTSDVLAPPSHSHWLGTDNLGRDIVARLLYGIRVSLSYGLLFWFLSYLIGVTIGSIQGYFGGKVDFTTERIKELAEVLPFLSVVILVNGLTKSQSFTVTLLVVVLFAWITISSQVRAQFLTLRRREFCEAAQALGAQSPRIIFKHILPNALTPILTLTPFSISAGISILAVLDFLGFGLNPPTPSLGELLQQGRQYITNAPWILLAPTAALALMLISINLVGEALRQAFDPKRG